MYIPKAHIFLLVLLVVASACTSPRWMVKDPSAIHKEDYRVLNEEYFITQTEQVSPENPILKFEVSSAVEYQYAEKILMQRTIQDYKVKPWVVALGLAGSALTAYAAHSKNIIHSQSTSTRTTLTVAALFLAGSGLLTMKPEGDPRPTGEERYLRRTGFEVQQDTIKVQNIEGMQAALSVWYGERKLIDREERDLGSNGIEVALGSLLNSLQVEGDSTHSVRAEVAFRDSVYEYSFALDDILQPYAQITSVVTPLRSAPEQNSENVLAELVRGGQLQIVDRVGEEWFKVLYGISENYISQNDAEIIWRSSGFAEQREVVAVDRIPFGNIDVESNIPILSPKNSNAYAVISTNENYSPPLNFRNYANRDGRLIATYLENALGFSPDHIYDYRESNSYENINSRLKSLEDTANDSSYLFIYLSGYGSLNQTDSGYKLSLIPVREDQSDGDMPAGTDLEEIFSQIAAIPSNKTIVLADIEFLSGDTAISQSEIDLQQPLRRLSNIIISARDSSAVMFSGELGQKSHLYVSGTGEDKKHHLFPYFFAKALQERNTNMGAIFQYLDRNVPYNSRRLHDEAQDPRLFGNTAMSIIPTR